MKRKAGVAILALICVAAVVGGYYYFTKGKQESASTAEELTEVQKVITKDLDADYPMTPRETVRVYNRIITCFYNETLTDEELYALGDQARKLLDGELLENNPRDAYFEKLKAEIEDFHANSKELTNITVEDSDEVEKAVVDGAECAYVDVIYHVSEKKYPTRSYQTYVLRKDEDGRWKILGTYQTKEDATEE